MDHVAYNPRRERNSHRHLMRSRLNTSGLEKRQLGGKTMLKCALKKYEDVKYIELPPVRF
jgi:hypothetical protein